MKKNGKKLKKKHGETYKQNIKIKIETYVELEPKKGGKCIQKR
jgi:hypothetical protein